MRLTVSFVALCCLLLAPIEANAQGGGHMSVLSGKTLGSGTVIHGQFGWPGLSASLLTSGGPKVDFGAKVSILYGYENMTRYVGIPGVKLQGLLRLNLIEKNKFNLGLRLSPGLFSYFERDYSVFGLTIPVDIVAGIRVTPDLMLNFGVDMPMFVAFGDWGGLVVPFLLGGGLEYALDSSMALTLNLRGGPSAPIGTPYYYWDDNWCRGGWGNRYGCGRGYGTPALEAQFGVSFKL